ncbi:MAG TPA: hypothetical protein EYP16_06740 [Candidatus Atribacteria bacterium]|nr:hypothetical protein [Candidatus Atribacteria bacterium]
MKVIQINPYEKKIEIAKLEDVDSNFSKELEKDIKEVEKDIKIVAYPVIGEERNGFFYYVTQEGNTGNIYTFKGVGIVFGKINEEMIEKIKKKIVWS